MYADLEHPIRRGRCAASAGAGVEALDALVLVDVTGNAVETVGMRSKEHAHDYRYFPEPDLVPLRVSEQWLEEVKAQMPELPATKRARSTTAMT